MHKTFLGLINSELIYRLTKTWMVARLLTVSGFLLPHPCPSLGISESLHIRHMQYSIRRIDLMLKVLVNIPPHQKNVIFLKEGGKTAFGFDSCV